MSAIEKLIVDGIDESIAIRIAQESCRMQHGCAE
jgi:hypothetical protein